MKKETALILRPWPAPVFSGLSLSPVCLCRRCATEAESPATGTKPAVSPRGAACTGSPPSRIYPIWTKTSWMCRFVTPAAFSLPTSLHPCTRTSSFRGTGTGRIYHSPIPLRHPSQCRGSTAAEDLWPSHNWVRLSPSRLSQSLISIIKAQQNQTGPHSVRGSCRRAPTCPENSQPPTLNT